MRHLTTVLAGTLLACLLTETAAIAQVRYYCPPASMPSISYVPSLRYFGITARGNHLDLDTNSLQRTSGGIAFTYYLNGNPDYGVATCREDGWRVGRSFVPATSSAARSMLNYICGSRVSSSW
ncbi:MAG: hypothetical protein NW224_11750 [Leptolyngbyaceae cyanobacterium bins.302]|nr:hypothetical protein [Leptolyngbyaceae cyanobacterium bins.302]